MIIFLAKCMLRTLSLILVRLHFLEGLRERLAGSADGPVEEFLSLRGEYFLNDFLVCILVIFISSFSSLVWTLRADCFVFLSILHIKEQAHRQLQGLPGHLKVLGALRTGLLFEHLSHSLECLLLSHDVQIIDFGAHRNVFTVLVLAILTVLFNLVILAIAILVLELFCKLF